MKKRLFAVGLLLIMVLSGCAPAASDTAEVAVSYTHLTLPTKA